MIGRFRQQDDQIEDPKGFDDYDMRLGDMMRGERATLGKSLLDVQRELKIKATYIAAIENADPSAFETPGFIAGYVRSYARYLGLDPEWAFKAFCAESGFSTAHGMSTAASSKRTESDESSPFGSRNLGIPHHRESFLARIEPGAIGSIVVLAGLIGLLGYGGYAVLSEVQRVQVVPVDQAPDVVADIDPLDGVTASAGEMDDPAVAAAREGFDRLYRPQALDVPVIVARDGPIGTLDPGRSGSFIGTGSGATPATAIPGVPGSGETQLAGAADVPDAINTAVLAALAEPSDDAPAPVVKAEDVPEVVVFAVRPSWVRVRAPDGTTLYEKIMEEGDRFVLPKTEEPATLRTGESGAIYFAINGEPYGPAGQPGAVTGNLDLSANNLTSNYEVANLSRDTALARVVAELQADPPSMPGEAAPTE
ncbi:helix-turn-helix domain-containing protein [Palleronia sp.]|uniref:helix-turn-helix domain-containing protein n=1 Tax=Palleronia sp. TaxID=1940284 RepID=UPI0035C851F6